MSKANSTLSKEGALVFSHMSASRCNGSVTGKSWPWVSHLALLSFGDVCCLFWWTPLIQSGLELHRHPSRLCWLWMNHLWPPSFYT